MRSSHQLVLASTSPRRQFLLKEAGYTFEVVRPNGDESFPEKMNAFEVPAFLARKKADLFRSSISSQIIITADTVVVLDGHILNKPIHRANAIEMLTLLSGKTHRVITGVCLLSAENEVCLDEHTDVTFKSLSPTMISSYVDQYQPFDKAGSYGAQECLPQGFNPCSAEEMQFLKTIDHLDLVARSITRHSGQGGMDAIEKIEGSYFNVMGLPIHKVAEAIKGF